MNILEIRQAVADYMSSEGGSCYQDIQNHEKHKEHLAKLLNVPLYNDGSGYDFYQFVSNKSKEDENE